MGETGFISATFDSASFFRQLLIEKDLNSDGHSLVSEDKALKGMSQ